MCVCACMYTHTYIYKIIVLLLVLYVFYGKYSILRMIQNCKFFIQHLLYMY